METMPPEKHRELLVEDLESLFKKLEALKNGKRPAWFGISGSWRATNDEIERGVREAVRKILERGDGVVSGGALNVDFFATDEALALNPAADLIKIFLPVTLEKYAAHYRRRATEGVITAQQAEDLIAQLERLQAANPASLIENMENTVVDMTTYYERNTEVVNASDAIVGFQANESGGVGDTVNKALEQRKPVCLKKYIIE